MANDDNNSEDTQKRAGVLRTLIILLFIYGGFCYSLSLLEYTWFQATGKPVFGVSERYESFTDEQLKQAFLSCGTHLMAATGVTTEQAGDPIVVRCGRFWPFYNYAIEVPAHPWIPGALIEYADEPEAITKSRDQLVQNVRLTSYAWMALAAAVFGLSSVTLYQYAVRRDQDAAFRWAFQTFISSLLMMGTYVGFSFWIDPLFKYGW